MEYGDLKRQLELDRNNNPLVRWQMLSAQIKSGVKKEHNRSEK